MLGLRQRSSEFSHGIILRAAIDEKSVRGQIAK